MANKMNDINITKEAMEEILNWNTDVRPRGYSEERENLIFDDEVDMDPELFKEIVDGFIMPTNEELIKIMSPLFSTPYITKEEAQAIFEVVPCS